MPRKPNVDAPLPELAGTLALLRTVAGDDLMAAALPLVRDRLRLTPDKLALMLVRLLNPDEILGKGEEADVRGVNEKTLRSHKEAKELPAVMQGS